MNIYEILSSIDHNKHYLHRYLTFINNCHEVNKKSIDEKYQLHHICPKALFPQYKNLKKYTWNGVYLTYRQHFIAHLILAKAIPHIVTSRAIIFMSRSCYDSSCFINSRLYSNLVSNIVPYKRTEKILDKLSNSSKNLVAAYDIINDENVRVTKGEFQNNDNLVGIVKFKNVNSYRELKEDHRENMSKAQKISKQNKIQCPHCMKLSDVSNYKRWHGDNCSSLPENKQTTVYNKEKNEKLFIKVKDLEEYYKMGYVIRSIKK